MAGCGCAKHSRRSRHCRRDVLLGRAAPPLAALGVTASACGSPAPPEPSTPLRRSSTWPATTARWPAPPPRPPAPAAGRRRADAGRRRTRRARARAVHRDRPGGRQARRRRRARPTSPSHDRDGRRRRRPRRPLADVIDALRASADSAARLVATAVGLPGRAARLDRGVLHGVLHGRRWCPGVGVDDLGRPVPPRPGRTPPTPAACTTRWPPNTRRSTATASCRRSPRPTSTTWWWKPLGQHRAARDDAIAMLTAR